MKRIPLPESWRERAIVISDVDDPESWFTTLPEFKTEKRKREWMLSRIAAQQLGDAPYRSLSHSGRYAGAAIGDEPVGIDVQVVRDIDERATHLFLSDDEFASMQRCTIAHRIIHFWCAKEAAWKQRRGEISTLKKIALKLKEETASGLLFDSVETFATEDVVVALTTLTRPTS